MMGMTMVMRGGAEKIRHKTWRLSPGRADFISAALAKRSDFRGFRSGWLARVRGSRARAMTGALTWAKRADELL
jgi:hypothetical protein